LEEVDLSFIRVIGRRNCCVMSLVLAEVVELEFLVEVLVTHHSWKQYNHILFSFFAGILRAVFQISSSRENTQNIIFFHRNGISRFKNISSFHNILIVIFFCIFIFVEIVETVLEVLSFQDCSHFLAEVTQAGERERREDDA
jgi:hypothetical protein